VAPQTHVLPLQAGFSSSTQYRAKAIDSSFIPKSSGPSTRGTPFDNGWSVIERLLKSQWEFALHLLDQNTLDVESKEGIISSIVRQAMVEAAREQCHHKLDRPREPIQSLRRALHLLHSELATSPHARSRYLDFSHSTDPRADEKRRVRRSPLYIYDRSRKVARACQGTSRG
jgi:hypothetical protein